MTQPEEEFVIVRTTTPTREEAGRLARMIVENRLGACVQTWPVHSTYWWKEKIEEADECLLMIKTRRHIVSALSTFISRNHPYDVPELVVTPVAGGADEYLAWIAAETDPGRKSNED